MNSIIITTLYICKTNTTMLYIFGNIFSNYLQAIKATIYTDSKIISVIYS